MHSLIFTILGVKRRDTRAISDGTLHFMYISQGLSCWSYMFNKHVFIYATLSSVSRLWPYYLYVCIETMPYYLYVFKTIESFDTMHSVKNYECDTPIE